MANPIRILQIGEENWAELVTIPESTEWLFCRPADLDTFLNKERQKVYDKLKASGEEEIELDMIPINFTGIFITSYVSEEALEPYVDTIEAYTLFSDSRVVLDKPLKRGIFRKKALRELPVNHNLQFIVTYLSMNLFSGQYGAKLKIPEIDIAPNFKGEVEYHGNVGVDFEGDFGEALEPLFTFRYAVPSFEFGVELWPEYIKEAGDVTLQFQVDAFKKGTLGDLLKTYHVTEEDLKKPYLLAPMEEAGFYNVSVFAKGNGKVRFGACHWRYSRMGLGQFVLGGKRIHDSKRQELAYYFNPGDMKPPLNVYFSGFRQAEGFEGFFMMKRLGAPFLLVADPRLEGGCFYSGSQELEEQLVKAIKKSLAYLDFDSSQLILSGLSMGAFGGLYYSADLQPNAVIVGKPFTDLGEVVQRLKLIRPDEFETSSDMLTNIIGDNTNRSAGQLNERFWEKFTKTKFNDTTFAIAYMEEDDYDGKAFQRLVSYTSDKSIHLYGKGYTGRHNDDSRSINRWFINQYHQILSQRFGRKF